MTSVRAFGFCGLTRASAKGAPSQRKYRNSIIDELFDDGVDSRRKFHHGVARRGASRKTLQLCRQTADTLNQVLGEDGDDVLLSLRIDDVRPAPDDTQLLVVVAPVLPNESLDASVVLARLVAVQGRLRTAVAQAITRRRAPKLLFQFQP